MNPAEVPLIIREYYAPEIALDQIRPGEREFCHTLLKEMGFRCVAGAISVGHDDTETTIAMLKRDAASASITVANSDKPEAFFAGPHPYEGIDNGIGIWAAA